MTLRTDFKDEILAESMNGRRRYRMIQNDDGTVSFEDVSELSVAGDSYGQKEINQLNAEVNQSVKKDQLIKSLAITEEGNVMDGKTCAEGINAARGTVLTGTLAAGATTLTFTDASITDDCMIDIYTNNAETIPSATVQSGNTLTLTFDAQENAIGVKVRVM